MQCKICNEKSIKVFEAIVLNKYKVCYFHCSNCGFLQTEDPFWLDEAYKESINISDTGILTRNLNDMIKTSAIIYFLFDKNAKFLDFGGGFGIFTRLMRDIGFDYYWHDLYTKNLVSKGFEYSNQKIEFVSLFEVFEHLAEPIQVIEKILGLSKNLFFSTYLLPNPVPGPNEWGYYGFKHGQHISFFSQKTLEYISKKFSLNFYTDGCEFHLLTSKKINKVKFKALIKLSRFGMLHYIKSRLKSKTSNDSEYITNSIES